MHREICARVRIMPRSRCRDANIWLHATRATTFRSAVHVRGPAVIQRNKLIHCFARVAGICSDAATCVPRLRINVVIFRQSEGRGSLLFLLCVHVKCSGIFFIRILALDSEAPRIFRYDIHISFNIHAFA